MFLRDTHASKLNCTDWSKLKSHFAIDLLAKDLNEPRRMYELSTMQLTQVGRVEKRKMSATVSRPQC